MQDKELIEILKKESYINENFTITIDDIIDQLRFSNWKWTDIEILYDFMNELYLEWKLNK